MEESNSARFEVTGNIRKKRTHTFRRPRPESQPCSNGHDLSPLSSTTPFDAIKASSSDENNGVNPSSKRKELSLNQCASKLSRASGVDMEKPVKKSKKLDIGLKELYNGLTDSSNCKSTSSAKESLEPKKTMTLKKVKLKLGGVTCTIDANSKSSRALDASVTQQKSAHKDNQEIDNLPPRDKKSGLQGIPWKDFSKVGFTLGRDGSSVKGAGKNSSGKHGDKSESARKRNRAPRKRAVNGFDDDDDDDDEIRYLEKLKQVKSYTGFGEDEDESSRKHRKLSKFSGNITPNTEVGDSSRAGKDGKKSSPSEDSDFDKEPDDSPVESKREITLTTRQRALLSSATGGIAVEFPDGLPPAPSRKPKEQLSEVEQQLKKAEAAQKRKMQNEKAARESEAEAIRRILGQDSNRKKREDKKKKRVEELAQEKAADELMRASQTVRVVMGPNGTTVTFPNEMGLPSIFDSKPHRYPPPREKCVGPSCTNPYKYRDSKTKVPLCSLQCYKAVQGNVQSEAATC